MTITTTKWWRFTDSSGMAWARRSNNSVICGRIIRPVPGARASRPGLPWSAASKRQSQAAPGYNRWFHTIGPEFSSDIYGMISPGMVNLAGAVARKYSHVNGYAEGSDGAV